MKIKKTFLMVIFLITLALSGCSNIEDCRNGSDSKSIINQDDLTSEIASLELQLEQAQQTNESLTNELNVWKDKYHQVEEDKLDIFNKIILTSERARESNIFIVTTLKNEYIWGFWKPVTGGCQGSGFVFAKDEKYYYALTNFHVIDQKNSDIAEYEVTLNSGKKLNGTIVAKGDNNLDVAIIKFPISGETIPLTIISNQTVIDDNEFILIVGNPNGLQNVVSTAQLKGYVDVDNTDYNVLYYTFSMESSGNSGGAVINIDGEAIGIHTWGNVEGDEKFAIPLDKIIEFLESNHFLVN